MGRFLLLIVALCWSAPSWADQRASYRQIEGGRSIVIEVTDKGDARIGWSEEIWYLIVLGGEAYVVYDLPAGKTVTRVADLEQVMRERGLKVQLEPSFLQQGLLVERGSATYAGHKGTAYYLKTPDGLSPRPAVVISRDPALAPLLLPLVRQFDFSLATMRLGGAEPPPALLLMRELFDRGLPLLFAGFELQRVDTAPVDAARLKLPERPKTIEELRRNAAGQ